MPLNSVLNRQLLATFRATLNTWKDAVNTLVTQMATALADILTLQGQITTALAKQDASARSTLNYNYRGTAISITCLNTDYNGIVAVTNVAPTNFTLPAPSGLADFRAGTCVILYNSPLSSGAVTLVPSSSTLQGSTSVAVGESAMLVMISATTWARLKFNA